MKKNLEKKILTNVSTISKVKILSYFHLSDAVCSMKDYKLLLLILGDSSVVSQKKSHLQFQWVVRKILILEYV